MHSTDQSKAETSPTETIENEISRLSWAVIDGRATSEQRERLAKLVQSQHSRRHPDTLPEAPR